jgi:hypothetical protein
VEAISERAEVQVFRLAAQSSPEEAALAEMMVLAPIWLEQAGTL